MPFFSIMEHRARDSLHFIQTTRGCLETKVHNTDSRGAPATKYQSLKVYENEDAMKLQKFAPGLVVHSIQVRQEVPVVDRTLEEAISRIDEFICRDAEDEDSEVDDQTTLKQLKERFITKKRKCRRSSENFNQDDANKKSVKDDLDELLSNLKPKRLKTLKDKTKGASQAVLSSSNIDSTIKPNRIFFSKECSSEVGIGFDSLINVKIEMSDPNLLGCQNQTLCADDSILGHNEVLNHGGIKANGSLEMIHPELIEPLVCGQEQQICVTNEISYDHLEDFVPTAMPCPPHGEKIKLEYLPELLDSPPLVIENQKEIRGTYSPGISMSDDPNSGVNCHSRCSSSMEEISGQFGQTSSDEILISDMTTEGTAGCVDPEGKALTDFLSEQNDTVSALGKNCGSFPDSVDSSHTTEKVVFVEETIAEDEQQPSTYSVPTEEIVAEEEQLSAYSFNAILRNDLHYEDHIEDQLLKPEDKQTSASPIANTESQSLDNQDCDRSETFSTSKLCQPILSRRKAISPSSQEKLCNAMKSDELCSGANQFAYKGKLRIKRTSKKASTSGSDMHCDRLTANHTEHACPQKVIINSRNIIKRSQNAKGNLDGPQFSRIFPKLSTGSICISTQRCSESAIDFSQRQMHDMECLASKLMTELKSLKDIVEQKLLFEAYRSVSLKNDADAVKSVINNATKVEDTARKWLSMMSRDCNRYCKIMEMTLNNTTSSKESTPRWERKKITFADEVGGQLCHVKFFEDDKFSNSDGVKQ